jgi:uncharacterized membrane protein HdeD (DUF308 family)
MPQGQDEGPEERGNTMDIAMTPTAWLQDAKKNAGWLIALGVISVIVGMLAIGSPMVAGMWVSMFVGVMLLISGIGHLVGALKAGSFGSGLLGFFGGALTTVAGVAMLFRPVIGVGLLTILLAAYLILDGMSGIALGLRVRALGQAWGWLVFSGVLGLVLGVLIYRQWPVSGVWAIGTLVGIHILFRGWSLIAIGMAARSGISAVQEEVNVQT